MTSQIPMDSSSAEAALPTVASTTTAAEGGTSRPTVMSGWLWVAYPLAMAAMSAVWGGVMQVLSRPGFSGGSELTRRR